MQWSATATVSVISETALLFQTYTQTSNIQTSIKHTEHLQTLRFLTDPAGAAQTRPLQRTGAEPLPDSRGEHLDPRASKEA